MSSAKIDSNYPALGNVTFQLALPDGAGNMTFWDAATGGDQLTPSGVDNVLKTWTMPSSGNFSGQIWVENDAPATVDIDPSRILSRR